MIAQVDFDNKLKELAELVGVPGWSDRQMAVFNHIAYSTNSLAVQASAGSGKTTVIRAGAYLIPEDQNAMYLAFNRVIAQYAKEVMPEHVPASTIHSYGLSVLRENGLFFDVKPSKMYTIIRGIEQVFKPRFGDPQEMDLFTQEIKSVVAMARQTRTNIYDTARMYNLRFERGIPYDPNNEDVYAAVLQLVDWFATKPDYRDSVETNSIARGVLSALRSLPGRGGKPYNALPSKATIDYTDMVELALPLAAPVYDVIFWDEGQDGNAMYLELILNSLTPDGRLIIVGDDKQNIMGWAGAFTDGMQTAIRATNADQLPLDVTFRCPRSHVEMADRIFPNQTIATDWAEEGEVYELNATQLASDIARNYVTDDSFTATVMCRFNAPAIQFALTLLSRRVPAVVKGRDFCKTIQGIIKKVIPFNADFNDFMTYLNNWHKKEMQFLIDKNAGDVAFQSLEDRKLSLEVLYRNSEAWDRNSFLQEIDQLFSDSAERIVCSSIHKMKGGEDHYVALLGYDALPLRRKNMTEAQVRGEDCVYYVALTRSKHTLILVPEED